MRMYSVSILFDILICKREWRITLKETLFRYIFDCLIHSAARSVEVVWTSVYLHVIKPKPQVHKICFVDNKP